jgi:membrane-bound lytic murein transglycosylase MltF
MLTTWYDAKKIGWIDQAAERTDPVASLKAQKALMNDLYNKPEMKSSLTEEERYAKTLAAYNTGYGNLRKAITKANTKGGNWFDYVSHETQKYVPMIMKKTEEEYFKNNEDYISKYDRGDVS